MYQYKIKKIHRIIDGDTVDVEISLGFGITLSQRVRLKGIDAAETRTKDLKEKAEGLMAKEWLEKNFPNPVNGLLKPQRMISMEEYLEPYT